MKKSMIFIIVVILISVNVFGRLDSCGLGTSGSGDVALEQQTLGQYIHATSGQTVNILGTDYVLNGVDLDLSADANRNIVNRMVQQMLSSGAISRACFLPTTNITMDEGYKEIQNINVGDKILSYDIKNKKLVVSSVLNVYSHIENEYMIINDKIKVTPYHMVYARKR